MEKGMEFFDGWVKSQNEFLDTWLKSQKDFLTNWTESMKKLQESLTNLGASQDGPGKEVANLFNAMFNNMTNSAKVFSDEAMKMQETWKITVAKQLEMSKEMMKNFSQLFEQAGGKK